MRRWLLALALIVGAWASQKETRALNHRYSTANESFVEIRSPRGPTTYLSTNASAKSAAGNHDAPRDVIFIINAAANQANQTHMSVDLKKSMNVTGGGGAEQRLFWHHPNNCPNHPFPPSGPYPPVVPCGGIFTSDVNVLVSPNHPGPYPPNARCTYKIKTPLLTPSCLRVSIAHLAIRWSPNCLQDWIQIGEGQPRLCGGLFGDKYFRSEGGFLLVHFHSGGVGGPPTSGFKIIVSRIPCHALLPPRPPPPLPPPGYPRPPLPGHRPPRPPPIYPPPVHKPPPYKWRWLWQLKCEWGGIDSLPPGKCPPPYPPRPYHPHPPPAPPFAEKDMSKTDSMVPPPPPQQGPLCNRAISSADFVTISSEWLPAVKNIGKHWSCRLTVYKAHPEACEIQLNLESLKLDCQQEWIEVAGQRICGEQPLRQLNVDFWGPEARIDYRNMGNKLPGTFLIRSQQSFECDPLILDVTPVKKLAATPPTPSSNYISQPITQHQPWK